MRHMRVQWLAWLGLCLLLAGRAAAANIAVAKAEATILNADAKTATVTFDLSWSNSWRNAVNWDAAWVFVKFRAPGSNLWEHAALSTTSADHQPAPGAAITAVPDGRGVFICSAAPGSGNVAYPRTKLLWHYGTNGKAFATGAKIEVAVFAIEMVYIPGGAFDLGSGGNEPGHFYQYTDGQQSTKPYRIASEAEAINIGPSNGNLCYAAGAYGGSRRYDDPSFAYTGSRAGVIPPAFPKGVNGFYAMKSLLSPRQYQDFLANLPEAQARHRTPSGALAHWGITGGKSRDSAIICLFWSDMLAYADWAGLRPLTELEYEKACRGAAPAAGAAATQPARYWPEEDAQEAKSTWERFISVGLASGRAFTGLHGNGELTDEGDANVSGWPGTDSIGGEKADGGGSSWVPVDVLGSGHRQSIALSASKPEGVGDRTFAAGRSSHRFIEGTWRGGRTAPPTP